MDNADSDSVSDCSSVASDENSDDLALVPRETTLQLGGPAALGPPSLQIDNVEIRDSSNVQIGHTIYIDGPIVLVRTPSVEVTPDAAPFAIEHNPTFGGEDSIPVTFDERFVTRGEWRAMPVRGEMEPLEKSPVDNVVIAHTSGTFYTDKAASMKALRSIQANCFNRGMYDICFNFMIGGEGHIYEGRGWDVQGAFAKRIESKSICIGFMGDFMLDLPPEEMVEAAFCLLEEGVRIGKLSPDYKLFAHKQVYNTESPGMVFIEQIMKWPHWALFE